MRKLQIAVLGAGNRGTVYADFIHRLHPNAQVSWVCDINPQKLAFFGERFNIPDTHRFLSADEMLNQIENADAIIISNLENEHCDYAVRALNMGLHVLLEKPMSNDPTECIRIRDAAHHSGNVLMVCHVLRFTPFFSKIKNLIDDNVIGSVVSIQHAENVSYTHIAHSYVRGQFNRSDRSPLILAKACHDIDILLWLAGSHCTSVSSFGRLSYFCESNAPKDAPLRCTDGCTYAACPYDARKYYLGDYVGWPVNMLGEDLTYSGRLNALKTGRYGRCVFHCDNNVVDHQVVNLSFENGITATFSLNGFNKVDTRTIKVVGTLGEIYGELYKNELHVRLFDSEVEEIIHLPITEGIHGGGDSVLIEDFLDAIGNDKNHRVLTNEDVSLESHLVTFAAEEARLKNQVIQLDEYVARFQ